MIPPPTKQLKELVLRAHNYICFYCGRDLRKKYERFMTGKTNFKVPTVDHIIPRWKGGTNDMNNLVACCYSCNQEKAAREHPHAK